MTRRRKTDGEKVANATDGLGAIGKLYLAARIDRLIRKRMAEAWDEGWVGRASQVSTFENPHRGRGKK